MMDRPDARPELLRGELRNLRRLNSRLGSLRLVRQAVHSLTAGIHPARTIEIVDLATGSADHPVALVEALRSAGRRVTVTAVDRSRAVLDVARTFAGLEAGIRFERRDIRALPYEDRSFDVALCSFALHHFSREDAVRILREMRRVSRVGFVVHDLARSHAAAAAAWLYTHLTTTNIMTRRDGPQSVMNAFLKQELRAMLVEAGVSNAAVWTARPFRLMAVARQLQSAGWHRGAIASVPANGAAPRE
jgi:ubiquinone/menaquinone biosynthesis C-methylase UbiE